MILSEKELTRRQAQAYKNRDSIKPNDVLRILCTKADDDCAEFKIRGRLRLALCQGKSKTFRAGQYVDITCTHAKIGVNGLGLFVDYYFRIVDYEGAVVLDGYEAQRLPKVYEAWED